MQQMKQLRGGTQIHFGQKYVRIPSIRVLVPISFLQMGMFGALIQVVTKNGNRQTDRQTDRHEIINVFQELL